MKALFLIGGVLFLLLGLLLLLVAVIVYFVGRSRRRTTAPVAVHPVAAAPPVVPAAPVENATVVLDVGRSGYGAMHGVSGALAGRVFPIEPNGFYIGRDRTMAQVLIEDGRVSKKHVWIGVRDGVVVAIDSGSTNGTYLNAIGPRITEVRLTPGDTLIVSDDVTRLTYQR
jgi:hypothetical protein